MARIIREPKKNQGARSATQNTAPTQSPWVGLPLFCICVALLLLKPISTSAQDYQQDYRYNQKPYDGYGNNGYQMSARQRLCQQLEQQLAENWIRRNQPNTDLPKLRDDIRKLRRTIRKSERRIERANCYEDLFIFGRELRRTKKCLRMQRKIDSSTRELERLKQRLAAATDSGAVEDSRNRLIRELSRNGCGATYQQEARRRNNNIFDNIFGGGNYYDPAPRYRGQQSGHIVPYATYRTMCVRKCDGYYYPVSYAALSNKFPEDETHCLSTCAAPAELYVYRNPGEDVEHMISLNGIPYSELPNAWRYRKEFIRGCSCKPNEYSPAPNATDTLTPDPQKKSSIRPQNFRNQSATVDPGNNLSGQTKPR